MKKVSVILTTYNSAKYVQKTIDSIQNQKGAGIDFEVELIAVDDCSSDNTIEVLKANDIVVLSTKTNSGGPNRGRNIGLKAATGDYISIADHDDEWKVNKIGSLLPYLENAPIVTSGYTVINIETGQEINRVSHSNESYILYAKNKTFLSKLTKSLKGQNTYLGSIMYDAKFKDIFFEEQYGVVDFDWVLRLFHNKSSIEVCKSLYNRIVDGKNLSLDESYRKKDFAYSIKFIENYEKEFPKEVRTSCKKIHGTMARYYYMINDMKKARFNFRKSEFSLKTIAYYLTTFIGSGYIKKKFEVFG